MLDDRNAVIGNLRGGGFAKDTMSGTVGGNVNLILRQGKIGYSYGGGENQNSEVSREPARVFGDINIVTGFKGAEENSLWYGSAMSSNGGSIKSTVRNINISLLEGTVNYSVKSDGGYNGGSGDTQGAGDCDDVFGTIDILIENAHINTLNGSGYQNADIKHENYHSRVLNQDNKKNAIHIVWNNLPEIDAINKGGTQGIIGTGYQENNDYVAGNVFIEYKNGDSDFIIATQISGSKDMTNLEGNFNIEMTGGRVAQVRGSADNYVAKTQVYTSKVLFDGCENSELGYLYYIDEAKLVNKSNVLVDSEKFSQFGTTQKPFYSVRNLIILEKSKLTTCNQTTQLQNDVSINDGTWNALGFVYVYEKTESENGHIFFNNYFALGYNHKDDKNNFVAFKSQNDEFVALESGYTGRFYGDVDLVKSDLSFMCPVNVSGNWIGGNSLLRLPAVIDGKNYDGTNAGGNIALNIDGDASEITNVNIVTPGDWKKLQMPKIKDNYITVSTTDKTTPIEATFVLGNGDAVSEGYYLKRVADPADEDNYFMWQVAKGETYNVEYKFVSDTKDKKLPNEIVDLLPVDTNKYVEGIVITPIKPAKTKIEVSNGVWKFKGWDADSKKVTKDLEFIGTWEFYLNMSELNQAPIISAKDQTIQVGDIFNPLKDVSAVDKEDGDLTKEIVIVKNTVDTTKAGTYEVTYKVVDHQGASAYKTIKVVVTDKAVEPSVPVKPTPPDEPTTPQKPILPQKPTQPKDPIDSVPVETNDKSDSVWNYVVLGILTLWIGLTVQKKENN